MISDVLLLPPSDSCKILVNFESLYGTWVDVPSVRLLMTIPSVDND